MIKRRQIEVFSLSFLDCLCCGFGAILLLFILSIGSGKAGIESPIDEKSLQSMRQQLAQIETDTAQKTELIKQALNRQQTDKERHRLESSMKALQSTLAALQQEFDIKQANLSIGQKANAEANRILQSFEFENLPPIGLPTEATHVVFIIDTSGSMRNQLTKKLHYGIIAQVTELLNSLPTVKKIQFLDTSGNYMLRDRKGFWLNDTPGLRTQALQRVLNYSIHSISDPVQGIRKAFQDLKPNSQAGDHMSIYVIGDDFRGSTQSFLLKLDRLNPKLPGTQKRAVSISAIGFPTSRDPFQLGALQGNTRFANIMREIAEAHDGVLILKPRI
ncbi:MAG: hypothetical protein ACJAYS_001013 [Lentimonas sp.]|jgi:hypothetical protein